MPSRFSDLRDISMIALLKQSGYIEAYDQINNKNIKEALKKNVECIKDWLISSENNRRDRGWYIMQNDNNKYIVGYFSKNQRLVLPEYESVEDACAEYIMREVEALRSYCK